MLNCCSRSHGLFSSIILLGPILSFIYFCIWHPKVCPWATWALSNIAPRGHGKGLKFGAWIWPISRTSSEYCHYWVIALRQLKICMRTSNLIYSNVQVWKFPRSKILYSKCELRQGFKLLSTLGSALHFKPKVFAYFHISKYSNGCVKNLAWPEKLCIFDVNKNLLLKMPCQNISQLAPSADQGLESKIVQDQKISCLDPKSYEKFHPCPILLQKLWNLRAT